MDPAGLRKQFDAGAQSWPGLQGSWDQFQAMTSPDDTSDLTTHAADLFLASACAGGEEAALRAFFETYDAQLRAIVGSLKIADDLRREARQVLETRLFVSGGQTAPKISAYRGRGPLLSFLRVVAVRTTQELIRRQGSRKEQGDEALAAMTSVGSDPEMAYLKKLYGQEFAGAFARAVSELEPSERTALHYALVDGLSIDSLAAVYGVHRATAARRVAKARAQLVAKTKEELMHCLEVDADTLESILRLVETSVEVSARRLLAGG